MLISYFISMLNVKINRKDLMLIKSLSICETAIFSICFKMAFNPVILLKLNNFETTYAF